MKRGNILVNDNNYYMLVRIEAEVPTTDSNGQKTDLLNDRYNLVNISTGKTRVSEPARMFLWPSNQENVSLYDLRSHFKMPNLQDTGVDTTDVDFGSVVAQAIQDKRMRTAMTTPASSTDATLNACLAMLRSMGLAG